MGIRVWNRRAAGNARAFQRAGGMRTAGSGPERLISASSAGWRGACSWRGDARPAHAAHPSTSQAPRQPAAMRTKLRSRRPPLRPQRRSAPPVPARPAALRPPGRSATPEARKGGSSVASEKHSAVGRCPHKGQYRLRLFHSGLTGSE
ncbi:hypothetical protein SLG_14700 [Sphingobium sp. SYK-6]|nr:hypothetical protein SLG_14700 [Sphingobium sp. SYK-6]